MSSKRIDRRRADPLEAVHGFFAEAEDLFNDTIGDMSKTAAPIPVAVMLGAEGIACAIAVGADAIAYAIERAAERGRR